MKVWTIKYHPEALRELIELDGQAKALAKTNSNRSPQIPILEWLLVTSTELIYLAFSRPISSERNIESYSLLTQTRIQYT